MSEIKQVWGIIKDYKCADLKMVQGPALAVFQHQQAIIDSLKAQLNNMEACYIEKKKQVEACADLAAGWNAITWDKTTHWTEGYEKGCYHCSAQIEKALRGGHE
ncbi:hypothetical protein [Acinetobacter sp.]|uniref:hypothetical protein n=1 Tax=Acinetobacter sp. TaxID=472 RepID=UPI003BAFC8C5